MKENKMGTEPVKKVMMGMGLPIIASMMLQACYNIVDSMFVARIHDYNGIVGAGEKALNALTLAFPIQILMIAFGIGTGVGVGALLSKTLGEGDREKVGKVAGNGIFLALIIYIVFLAFGLFGTDIYLRSQTSDPVILSMGNVYLKINCIVSFGIIFFSIFEKLLQSTGKSHLSTIAMISGAVTNIVLDPIMIFGLLGCPKMGVAGAAWATVLGQIVSVIVGAKFHFKKMPGKDRFIPVGFKYLKLDKELVKAIYVIGAPAIVMQALMSFMTYGVNIIFAGVSTAAVTAYGIFYKIQQFIYFAAFGMRDAITPITSYNFGMKSKSRIRECIKYGLIYTIAIMLIGTVLLEIFAGPLVNAFALSSATAKLCVRAVRIIAIGFFAAGANIAIQGFFQSFRNGMSALITSCLRLAIIVLPLAYIFARSNAAEYLIWAAFPIAEIVTALISVVLLKKSYNENIKSLEN